MLLHVLYFFFQFLHHSFAADKQRGTLVQLSWLYVQYPFFSIGRLSPGHFGNKSKWIAFVQKSQFTIGFIHRAGIHEDATFDEVAMNVGYHAADIPLRIRAAGSLIFFLASLNIILHGLVIAKKIAVVNRINFPELRTLDVGMAQAKLN